jgi:L-alanine-DL-glutamate epimerase-like enolase superfamily enzyme
MARITEIRTILLGYRKTDPPMQRGFALVRIETETGRVGFGEASSNWGHSYPTVIETIVDDVVAPNLTGQDAANIRERVEQLHVLLDGYLGWDGVSAQVIGAVEIALWDLLGKDAGLPISTMLGGGRSELALYGTGTTMFEETPEWHARYFDAALAKGVKGVKVRLGKDPAADLALVRTVRDHVGPDLLLMADAYWGYAPDEALELALRLAEHDVFFFEEPSPQYDLAGLQRLCERSPVRIAAGERIYSPSHYRTVAERRAAHVFEPDASICGGILACLEVVTIARAHGIRVVPHVGGPTPIGMAANLHWAAAAGCSLIEYDIDPHQPIRDQLARGGALGFDTIEGGMLRVPTGPGLGIEIDEAMFESFPYRSGETYAEVFPEHETGRQA